ncbi:glutaminyl-peptide cyclotransferase [Altibacter sp. HG106]|uniref:glutaminyl-peptide cyclotransferase n=1 Tax=Altibacter sp. HG106 TaxID=3023937 RepID=UPI00235026E3|nr:glutaminyl-peptide cyclotransferase [Altibacter sp. HG106]MDC7993887.1 glutaminyl-peptide cyclotransferase [Altibacter sp. HG106]
MKSIYNLFFFTALALSTGSCGDSNERPQELFSIEIGNKKKAYRPADELQISLQNKKGRSIDSVAYFIAENRLAGGMASESVTLPLQTQPLGSRMLTAKVYAEGEIFEVSQVILLLSDTAPVLYTYEILERYPHDQEAYTQGLEFRGDILYESTGQYQHSTLRKTNYETGEVLQQVDLKDTYFGEGLTILKDKVYQLTWRENTGFVYNANDLSRIQTFQYAASKEGWGLCNDGATLYKSDGTQRIWRLDPTTLEEQGYIEMYTHKARIKSVNEMEWVDGKIYANIYEAEGIAIVNPESGAVEGVIDCSGLKEEVTQHPDLNVLNGIAYKGEPNILYLTGKNWDQLFKVRIVKK